MNPIYVKTDNEKLDSVWTYNNPEVSDIGNTESSYSSEFARTIYLDCEFSGGDGEYCSGTVYSAQTERGYVSQSGFTLTSSEKVSRVLSLSGTIGISLEYPLGNISKVYTNATIVAQTNNKVVISGLRHNTHIVVVAA